MRKWVLAACGVLAVLVVVAGPVIATNAGGARTTLLEMLGDERRHQVVALLSGLNARTAETADMVPIRHVGVNPLGVNTFLEQEAEVAKRRRTMEVIHDAGIGFIRQQFPWEDIEVPSKGRYWDEKYGQSTWDKYDNIVDLAVEHGLQLIVRLDLPPKWAHPNNAWPHTPPDNLEDYGDFVHTVVSRYRGKVRYYQLWNEPNLSIEWGGKPVDAGEYIRLLKVGYERAKEADPDAVILSAALAPTIEESWRALNDLIYLQRMYDAGAKEYFDVMSAMAYGLRSGPDDRRLDDLKDVNFSRPIRIREIMVRNGDASKPIWASEMGWNVQPASVATEPIFGRVSEDLQARYTVRGLQRAAEEWSWMGVMNLWFLKRASDAEKDQPFYYFRMMEPDFEPLPVYDAVKAYGTLPATMRRGYSQEDHWALQYEGAWHRIAEDRAGLGGLMTAGEPAASVSALFHGTDLALVVPKGPAFGSAHLQIDGSPVKANRLPRDGSGRAVLDLSAPEPLWLQQVPIASGLSHGVHRLELRTAGPFALDGVVVDVQGAAPPPWLLGLPAVAGLLLGTAIGLKMARRGRTWARPSAPTGQLTSST